MDSTHQYQVSYCRITDQTFQGTSFLRAYSIRVAVCNGDSHSTKRKKHFTIKSKLEYFSTNKTFYLSISVHIALIEMKVELLCALIWVLYFDVRSDSAKIYNFPLKGFGLYLPTELYTARSKSFEKKSFNFHQTFSCKHRSNSVFATYL